MATNDAGTPRDLTYQPLRATRGGEFYFNLERQAGYLRLRILNTHRMDSTVHSFTPAELDALRELLARD
jgi:hypothetical protein